MANGTRYTTVVHFMLQTLFTSLHILLHIHPPFSAVQVRLEFLSPCA